MKQIQKFTKTEVKNLRPKIDKALKELGKEFGITFNTGNAGFDNNNIDFKLAVHIEGADSVEEAEYKRYCSMYDMKPEWLHKEVKMGSRGLVKLVGLSRTARKYVVTFENKKGEQIMSTVDSAIKLLAA